VIAGLIAIWDQAAGALLVEEAGGRVSDLHGLPLDFTTGRHLLRNTGLIASNGLLHDAVLGVVRRRIVTSLNAAVEVWSGSKTCIHLLAGDNRHERGHTWLA
jgi:hypothetical protein